MKTEELAQLQRGRNNFCYKYQSERATRNRRSDQMPNTLHNGLLLVTVIIELNDFTENHGKTNRIPDEIPDGE